jgi:hypothetical protein
LEPGPEARLPENVGWVTALNLSTIGNTLLADVSVLVSLILTVRTGKQEPW